MHGPLGVIVKEVFCFWAQQSNAEDGQHERKDSYNDA